MSRKKRGSSRVAVENAVKTLAANIRFASVDDPVSTIVVTSSVPDEGKTFVSVELARALAASGKRVLLMECDMHKRSLAATLGVHSRYGIYDVLSGEADLDEAIITTPTPNLHFLDSEPNIPNPTDVLSSKRFRGLLQGAHRVFSYVIMDTPPVGAFVDAAILGSVADATVLVVREDFVHRNELLAAYAQLKQAGANLVGTVLNCCDTESGSYGYYGYYGYYGAYEEDAPAEGRAERDHAEKDHDAEPAQEAPRPASGLRPLPQTPRVPPDSTAQFIAGYRSRTHEDE